MYIFKSFSKINLPFYDFDNDLNKVIFININLQLNDFKLR